MNTAKIYYDSNGNECTIYQAVTREPSWAATRIQEGEKAVEKMALLESRVNEKDDQIVFLWKLLDDISTAGDMFKPEINGYFNAVNKLCEERGLVANSPDGKTLEIKEFTAA